MPRAATSIPLHQPIPDWLPEAAPEESDSSIVVPDEDHLFEVLIGPADCGPNVTPPHPSLTAGIEWGEPRPYACILPAKSLGNVAVAVVFIQPRCVGTVTV